MLSDKELRQAVAKLQEDAQYAIQSDLEQGVAWMNDEYAAHFAKTYVEITKILDRLGGLEVTDD